MFVRLHRQKQRGKTYTSVQICESYRDPKKGNSPRNRVLLNLGPAEKLGIETLRKLADGFARAAGVNATEDASESTISTMLSSGRDFGHVHAVGAVWDRLGLSKVLDSAGIQGDCDFPVVETIRLLAVNRLCEPMSKLALLDWMDGVFLGEIEKPPYHHLMRAMDRLIDAKDWAEPKIARKLVGDLKEVDLVFYDITSTYFEGDRSLVDEDVRRFGYSRDNRADKRQVVIGMVMTREGVPLCHHVFSGNTADKTTVSAVIKDLKKRFALKRVIFVGDRGMLSDGNLKALLSEKMGFIVAHPLRRNALAREVIGTLHRSFDRKADSEQYFEEERQGVRFVVAYSPEIAAEVKNTRRRRLMEADKWIAKLIRKLKNPPPKGRKPTAQRTYDRIRDYLRDRGLLRYYNATLFGGVPKVVKDRQVLQWESKIDGALLLETTDMSLPAEEVVKKYKELAEIERGWRSLKSTILLRPVYHWSERRIRAHVFVCVLALQLERWMRNKLRELDLSAPKAIELLQRIKAVEFTVNGKTTLAPTRPTRQQTEVLRCLGAPPIPAKLRGSLM